MLRKMILSDAAAIQRLNANDLGYDYPLAAVEEKAASILSDTKHHLVFVYQDPTAGVVGYVHGERYETFYAPTMINVLALVVSKEYEKRGIGRKLLTKLESEAVKQGYQGIRLNSGANRTAAHQFYQHIGYQMDKEQKRFIKYL
ncbi:MAG TPA: GNAT family N-acetyltransferase [Enterococcus sp.]|nr:GNAT family N-acetyltransferase [Enterococcus sp.]